MTQILSRQELYALVWSKPMTAVAKDFGLSDVALHKICRRHDVPTPAAGYWMKKAFGKPVNVAALPRPADLSTLIIHDRAVADEPQSIRDARAAAQAALDGAGEAPTPNSIVERTIAKLRNAKANRDGLIRREAPGLITVAVQPQTLELASDVLEQFAAAGERAGLELIRTSEGVAWRADGQTVTFELVEATDQVEHVATAKELAAVAKWRKEREETHRRYGYWSNYGEPKIPKWEKRFGGRLIIRLEEVRLKNERQPWGEPIPRSFAESRTRKLERMIPRAIITVAAMMAAKRSNVDFEEQQRIAAVEAAKRRAEAERRRMLDEGASKILDSLIDEHDRAERLRKLLTRVDPGASSRVAAFVSWAQQQLAVLDLRLQSEALEQRLCNAGLFADELNQIR